MPSPKTISCGGADAIIHGNPGDFYFEHAQAHADGLKALGTLAATVRGQAVSVDIGANIGLSTIVLARARPDAKVIAIDPSPVNIAFLRQNLQANGLGNVNVIEAAVSDRPGELRLHVAGAWSHVVSPAHMLPQTESIAVPVTTLDTVTEGQGPVGFVKIDTEGHEPHVLAGGRRVLERDRPLLLMEFHSWCLTGVAGVSPAAFCRALWASFDVRRMSADGEGPLASETALDFLHANMTQRGLVDDLVLRLRDGAAVPSLEAFSLPAGYADELARLRADNDALRGSTSWRITRPLRRLALALRPRPVPPGVAG